MVVALGTDLKIPFDNLAIDDLITGVAFHPKGIRGFQFLSFLFLVFPFLTFFKPGHLLPPSSPWVTKT
jgi:hypothetical protein